MIKIIWAVPTNPIQPLEDAPKPFEFRSELFKQQQQEWKNRPARPKLPCPPLPVYATDGDEDPVVDPRDFFSWREDSYAFCLTRESNLIEGFEDEIDAVPPCFQEFPFPPHPRPACPMHESLSAIAAKFLGNHKEIELVEKIELCEQFVGQFVSKIAYSFSDEPPALEKPLFVCLEIALRAHLFNQLVEEEKSDFISFFTAQSKFPCSLKEREDALEMFVTKNGFFISPDPFFHSLAPMNILEPLLPKVRFDSLEDQLQATLSLWKSEQGSRTCKFIEDALRENLNHALVTQLVLRFKGQFHKTGLISREDFNFASGQISSAILRKTELNGLPCVKKQVLAETFGLCQENGFSFQWLHEQIKAEKVAQLALPEPSKYFPSFGSTRSKKTCLQLDEKLKTLAWAEEEWKACCLAPVQAPIIPKVFQKLALGCVKAPAVEFPQVGLYLEHKTHLRESQPRGFDAPQDQLLKHFRYKLKAWPVIEKSKTLSELHGLLPNKELFYEYVYKEAVAAGVHIESWDHQFAEYNWNKESMIAISMRAVNRCLHPHL